MEYLLIVPALSRLQYQLRWRRRSKSRSEPIFKAAVSMGLSSNVNKESINQLACYFRDKDLTTQFNKKTKRMFGAFAVKMHPVITKLQNDLT